ncbi:MAG: acyl-CoA thioesterase [Myxococcales bacterium]|nr:MAG: acyl-CoA thioesterase [Myxococcales bacterium]
MRATMNREGPQTPRASEISLNQLMLPEHANALGNVHGGVILKMVDEAGAIAAMRHARKPCVTIAIDSMTFKQPVHVGQLMVCQARVSYVGRSSIEVQVLVHAEDLLTREVTHTNSAYAVYVALGADGKSAAAPELVLETEEDSRLFGEGQERQRRRTARA